MANVPLDVNNHELRLRFLQDLVPENLASLRDWTEPNWGQMTAQQMVEHLLWAFEISNGRAHVDCSVPESKRERMKAILYDDRCMPRNFKNPTLVAGLPPLRYPGIQEAKAALAAEVEHFLLAFATESEGLRTHPVFGAIGVDEWSRVHFKHCYHHLLQFGLLGLD
jgi:oxepin-CoA hydrolase/3-oxo-5,6-dehydrosuberyl-CoA semialdehyde dehydrogenase